MWRSDLSPPRSSDVRHTHLLLHVRPQLIPIILSSRERACVRVSSALLLFCPQRSVRPLQDRWTDSPVLSPRGGCCLLAVAFPKKGRAARGDVHAFISPDCQPSRLVHAGPQQTNRRDSTLKGTKETGSCELGSSVFYLLHINSVFFSSCIRSNEGTS